MGSWVKIAQAAPRLAANNSQRVPRPKAVLAPSLLVCQFEHLANLRIPREPNLHHFAAAQVVQLHPSGECMGGGGGCLVAATFWAFSSPLFLWLLGLLVTLLVWKAGSQSQAFPPKACVSSPDIPWY